MLSSGHDTAIALKKSAAVVIFTKNSPSAFHYGWGRGYGGSALPGGAIDS